MKLRRWVLAVSSLVIASAVLAGAPMAKSPDDFDDATPDTPLPPGVSQRVFIHLPRTFHPNHLGTCTSTTDDTVNGYGLAG